ncbi:MAG: hypothetical protein JWN21_2573 [Sphingomonas bacterium]|uniref:hypothetical protein n=1 Tax=Sphingomonas bacterium TaxID=1895847 RepID=UPI00262A6898|nr:hypothetical protein [Sphingomonas bacterium]MDB5697030.1 hypothetical protein [Sphingomonas bacterium]
MMAVIGTMVFMGAMTLAMAVIWLSVAPQWRRIVRLASGHVEQSFNPLQRLAMAERRIAVRRWASAPASVLPRMRAAA